MKIREIRLRKFKRFSETTIADVPKTARLVVLAGPNGCGKSSLIDAAYVWHGQHWAQRGGWNESYHYKHTPGAVAPHWHETVEVVFHDPQPATPDQRRKAVYARSAYRNDPEFQLSNFARMEPAVREHRFSKLIDNDMTVGRNYQRLVSQGIQDVFETLDGALTLAEYRTQAIGEIRDATERLFPGLVLNSLGNPLAEGTFRFDKGDSTAFMYMNLSGGEKAAFDLLLDLIVKRREFDDTAFFIDEPEAHIAAGLQGKLLHEVLNLIPDGSQLWIATHSLGMMRKARDMSLEHPGTVAFLDFEGANFDLPTTLRPVQPDRPFWKRAMQIALDDLAGYVAPEQVVLCEGETHTERARFDSECYNKIFASELPGTLFLSAGSADEVQTDRRGVQPVIRALAPGSRVLRLIDRDDRTDQEIEQLRAQGVRVLNRRHIESYLLDDEVLRLLCTKLDAEALGDQLVTAKAEALQHSVVKGGAADDFKRTAGDVYLAAKRIFANRKLGSDQRAFMKEFCAPLVRPGTAVYSTLKADIFGT